MAAGKHNLLLLGGLLLCGGVAADHCLVKFEQGDASFTGSLSVKGEKVATMKSETPEYGGKENAEKLATEYRNGIKDKMGIMHHGCTTSRWEIRQTGKMEGNADWAAAMSDAILKKNTRVRCEDEKDGEGNITPFSNCIPVDFKTGGEKIPSFNIDHGKVVQGATPRAKDCLVKFEQDDTSFTGSISVKGEEVSKMTSKEKFDLQGEKHLTGKEKTLANALALATEYRSSIIKMGIIEHGCTTSRWEIRQTGSMEGNADWADAMSKAILETNTRVRCPDNDDGNGNITPFSNCIPVDFEAGTSKFTINKGKVQDAAGLKTEPAAKPKPATKPSHQGPTVSSAARASSRRLL